VSQQKECLNYQKLDPQTVQCRACSHFCKIKDGRVGVCGVRQNKSGKLYSLVYGKAVAAHIDPIEKKPLYHFLPGSTAYSFGTFGCNFRGGNCQNYDISQILGLKSRVEKYDQIDWGLDLPPEKIVAEAVANGCPSIAYTYNEPTVFLEYALGTMKLARRRGVKNVWVSNGFMSPETLNLITPQLDAINVDIKSCDDKFYQSNCGARLQPVLDNCQSLVKAGVWLEITTLVIPTLSDDLAMLRQVAKFIKERLGDFVPWHISAFSGAISWKLQHLTDTPLETICQAYQIGKEVGLKYVYAGNIPDRPMETTFCPQCQRAVIERSGYIVRRYDKNGKCSQCGTKIEGKF